MLTVYTWQGIDFDLKSETLDQSKSRYADAVPCYLRKLESLNKIVRTNKYLWAFLRSDQHQYFEICKPVEWVLEVAKSEILGYLDNNKWEQYLRSEDHQDLEGVFQKEIITQRDQSVLIRHPFKETIIKRKRVYKITHPKEAELIDEIEF